MKMVTLFEESEIMHCQKLASLFFQCSLAELLNFDSSSEHQEFVLLKEVPSIVPSQS